MGSDCSWFEVSFWDDENDLELAVPLHNSVHILKTTD